MRFTKMQGVGNDFVVLDASEIPVDADLSALAIRLCDRQFGIGADGLLVVSRRPLPPSPSLEGRGGKYLVGSTASSYDAMENGTANGNKPPLPRGEGDGGRGSSAVKMRMFNPDGTEDVCGNGMRCVGLWAHRADWLGGQTEFDIDVLDGPRRVKLVSIANDKKRANLTVDMGRPKFAPEDVPMCGEESKLRVGNRVFPIVSVNTGSTHTVIFCDEMPDEATFQHYSPLIENHPCYPERTSVMWAKRFRDENTWIINIWERGAGETLGCGTGACAVAVAARYSGLVSNADETIKILSKGGALGVRWPGGDAEISMTGPAAFVFDGDFFL